MAEALGVRWAIQYAIDQGINSVSINCDAANVVHCVNKRSTFASIYLTQDCRDMMDRFENVSILFVSRLPNVDDHNLASLAKIVVNRS
jgi:hypothetical protein